MYQDLLPGKYALRVLRHLADRAGDEHARSLANRALYGRTREERREAHRRCNAIVAGGAYLDAAEHRTRAQSRARWVELRATPEPVPRARDAREAGEACEVIDLALWRNGRA